MKHIVPSAALLLLLAACGGGGDGAAPAPDPGSQVPPGASESSGGLFSYLDTLVGVPANEKEPMNLDGFEPKTADDKEPDPVS